MGVDAEMQMSSAKTRKPAPDLQLVFLTKRTAGQYAALCPDLDIASCGSSENEAIESLKGLVELYIEDCFESGLDHVPLRPTPREALEEFLAPPPTEDRSPITSRRIPVRVASHAGR
jgi:predicted RNase H-like HicB family nuclease